MDLVSEINVYIIIIAHNDVFPVNLYRRYDHITILDQLTEISSNIVTYIIMHCNSVLFILIAGMYYF